MCLVLGVASVTPEAIAREATRLGSMEALLLALEKMAQNVLAKASTGWPVRPGGWHMPRSDALNLTLLMFVSLLANLLALVVLRARADCRNSGATGPLLTSIDNGRQLLDVLCGASRLLQLGATGACRHTHAFALPTV